jgi:aldehyde:ferredoxin oxidoreductase
MALGYCGRILHVDLSSERITLEAPPEAFYRTYLGGSAMGLYYLLSNVQASVEPLSEQNLLALMCGPLTGSLLPGTSRFAATTKSPLTGLAGSSEAGGYWGSELKMAGYDGIVIQGRARRPVYLFVDGETPQLLDAKDLWGSATAEVEDRLRERHGDRRVQVLQCGPAGEKGVRFSCLINSRNRANGRNGMGAVMGAKNLRAIAVRANGTLPVSDPAAALAFAKRCAERVQNSEVARLGVLGTAECLLALNEMGALPTRNWSEGRFEHAEAISGEAMAETILKARDTCFACPVRCKRVVEVQDPPFKVDPEYGGPEYETLAAFGSFCGVNNLAAIARANQLCNMYGLDTISCGATIAWAMDCWAHGLLKPEQTGGIEVSFGNASAMVSLVDLIGRRTGFGEILGEGSMRAAGALGFGSELCVVTKNQEFPAHSPHAKRSLSLVYSVNPYGADHQSHEHDPAYEGAYRSRMAELGLHGAEAAQVLDDEKVRFTLYTQYFYGSLDSICACQFVFGPASQLCGPSELVEAARIATGWNLSLWEIMKVGERRLNMLRVFNAREGSAAGGDTYPEKLLLPPAGKGDPSVATPSNELDMARKTYYQMAGWDDAGQPTRGKLGELGLSWLVPLLVRLRD